MAQELTTSKLIKELFNRQGEFNLKDPEYVPPVRNSLYPIRDSKAAEFRLKQQATVWFAHEIDFTEDREEFYELPKYKQRRIKLVLSFFSNADDLVGENLGTRFKMELYDKQDKSFLICQEFMEDVHAETYEISSAVYFPNDKELEEVRNSLYHVPSIKKKAEWMRRYELSDLDFRYRLIAFCCAEGIMFMTSFAEILSHRPSGKLQGLVQSNLLISQDETLHRNYGAYLFTKYAYRGGSCLVDIEKVYEIIREAVEIEKEFVDALFEETDPDYDLKDDYLKFVECVADDLCVELELKPLYNQPCPLSWMNDISNLIKENFHEVRPTAYRRFNPKEALRKIVELTEGDDGHSDQSDSDLDF